MHYNNGSEAVTQLCLNCLFHSLVSGRISLQRKSVPRFQLLSFYSILSPAPGLRVWWMRVVPPVKPSLPLKRLCHLIRETLCKLSSWASTQMEEGLPTTCQAAGVYTWPRWRVCWKLVCSWFVPFINTWVLDMPTAVYPRLIVIIIIIIISSRRAAIALSAGTEPPCLHTLDESQLPHPYYDAPFSSLRSDTVAKATTHDHFLFLLIYRWLAVLQKPISSKIKEMKLNK